MSLLPAPGTLAGEAVRAAFVAAIMMVLLVATEQVHRRWHPPVEWTRKVAHVGGGLLAMAFPWLFRWPLTVVALCLAMGAMIALGIRNKLNFGIEISRGYSGLPPGASGRGERGVWIPALSSETFLARHAALETAQLFCRVGATIEMTNRNRLTATVNSATFSTAFR